MHKVSIFNIIPEVITKWTLILGGVIFISSCTTVFDSVKKQRRLDRIGEPPHVLAAVLLPLTGEYSEIASAMLNTMLLAYDVQNTKQLVLDVYDTKGDPKLAAQVAQSAVNNGASVIIGPLLSAETKSVADALADYDVPIFTFSSDINVLKNQNNVYTVGYMLNSDLETMVDFAINYRLSSRFSIAVPYNDYGRFVASLSSFVIQNKGGEVIDIVTYPEDEPQLTPYLQNLVTEAELTRLDNLKKRLDSGEVVYDSQGNEISNLPPPNLDFDALIIGDFGRGLLLAASHIPVININPNRVAILGTSLWEKEDRLYMQGVFGAYFPSYDGGNSEDIEDIEFVNLYRLYYHQDITPTLASSYDVISIVSSLVYLDMENNLVLDFLKLEDIETVYSGLYGDIVLRSDGSSYKYMNVLRLYSTRNVLVSYEMALDDSLASLNYDTLPEIELPKPKVVDLSAN